MHHVIYVDIMMLHKAPEKKCVQKSLYLQSKFVTLYALSQRNWKPKKKWQCLVLGLLKILPCKFMAKRFYKNIYKYDSLSKDFMYCYWITPAKFKNGLFDKSFFEEPIDIAFEDTKLLGSTKIKEYLEYRYGDYMRLPSEEQQKASVHAMIYDVEKDYKEYMNR